MEVKEKENPIKVEDEGKEHQYGPSLKQIVINYIVDGEESEIRHSNWLDLLEAMDIQMFQ